MAQRKATSHRVTGKRPVPAAKEAPVAKPMPKPMPKSTPRAKIIIKQEPVEVKQELGALSEFPKLLGEAPPVTQYSLQ